MSSARKRNVELELELKKKGNGELLKLVEDISNLADIHYIRQKEPKGLGHAVYCAKTFVGNEPFAVLLGDDVIDSEVPVLKQMIKVYEKYNCSIIGVQEVKREDVPKYEIIDAKPIDERTYKVENLVEKPPVEEAPSNLAILGRYIITPKIFEILENTKPGRGGEIQLTDALKGLLDYEVIYAYNFEGKRYDVGDKMGYLAATVEFALKREDLSGVFRDYLINLICKK